jgi:hypothetical protein
MNGVHEFKKNKDMKRYALHAICLEKRKGRISALGMVLLMYFLQLFLCQMCVNLRRRNIHVPEQFLDGPEIGAVFYQMSGK